MKYTLSSSNLIKLIPLIPKPCFKTCICQFLMILFLPKFIINVTTLILKMSISHFRLVMFLPLHPMESISLNSFVLLVYISQLICFARASSHVVDFNTHNKLLTQKLLKQGYGYHKLRKTFSKFYRRYYDLISKF